MSLDEIVCALLTGSSSDMAKRAWLWTWYVQNMAQILSKLFDIIPQDFFGSAGLIRPQYGPYNSTLHGTIVLASITFQWKLYLFQEIGGKYTVHIAKTLRKYNQK